MHTRSYIKGYPRPMLTRDQWINLEGKWKFIFDDDNIGKNEEWYKSFPSNHQDIVVPYSYHTKNSLVHDTTYHPFMWYKTELSIKKNDNEKTVLHFEAVDHYCEVYINGNLVGKHIGGYNRFSFDITSFVEKTANDLIIYVEDDMSKEKPRGKQRYKKENFECWYVETSGIWKTPWIETVPQTYIEDTKYTFGGESLLFQTNVIGSDGTEKIKLTIFDEDITLVNQFISSSECITLNKEIKYWSHLDPKLYDIELEIIKDNKVIDHVKSYIGFRTIDYSTTDFKINDKSTYLKMILDQGYFNENHLTAFEYDIVQDLKLIQEMGFNGIRKHEKIESSIYNYYCDIFGIYNWQEMPSPYFFTEKAKENFTNEWIETVNQYYNHPSIITWVPFNESWGIFDVLTNKEEQIFTLDIYNITKKLDLTRPVVSNDGWEHTQSDIITLHNYAEYGEGLYNTYGDIKKILNNESTNPEPPKKAFAEGFSYEGQPIMLTEFGGIAFSDDEGWGYGNAVQSVEDFIKRLESQMLSIKKMDFFKGYCLTQLTDVQQEVNGVLKEDRTPKIPISEMKRLNNLFD